MNIALLHDHLISDGGGERVLKAFAQVWPEAPIFTLLFDPDKTNSFFRDKNINTSYLQRLPLATSKYQWNLPLRPKAVESFDLSGFDVVLSNSSSLVKGVRTSPDTLHINYCHTPTRFLWVDKNERLDPAERFWPISKISNAYKKRLKVWDLIAADRVDGFIANSRNVQDRIKKYYNRDSVVIYPPVDVGNFLVGNSHSDHPLNPSLARRKNSYFLIGGRIASYKRFDMVVRAFNKLGIHLKVFGLGPWLSVVKKKAGPNIEFIGAVPESEKIKLLAQARAFIHPQVEDFGITAVESMAVGTPVIAYQAGGALETVKDGKTGVFFADQDWQALADCVIRFESAKFDPSAIKQHTEQFSANRFKREIREYVDEKWNDFKDRN